MKRILHACIFLLALIPLSAVAQDIAGLQAFVGTWKLNPQKSDLPDFRGGVTPNATLIFFECSPEKVRYRATFLDPTGRKHTRAFDAKPDAKLHRLGGTDGAMSVGYAVEGNALKATWKLASGETITETTSLSSDGHTLTAASEGAGMKSTEVYDRQL
jgi:hypothetical protein